MSGLDTTAERYPTRPADNPDGEPPADRDRRWRLQEVLNVLLANTAVPGTHRGRHLPLGLSEPTWRGICCRMGFTPRDCDAFLRTFREHGHAIVWEDEDGKTRLTPAEPERCRALIARVVEYDEPPKPVIGACNRVVHA
jgi:hypothetical protein